MFMFIVTEALTSGNHSTKTAHVPCQIGQVLGFSNNVCIFTRIILIYKCICLKDLCIGLICIWL